MCMKKGGGGTLLKSGVLSLTLSRCLSLSLTLSLSLSLSLVLCSMCIPEFIGNGGCAALKAGDANMYVPPTCHGCGMGAMIGCGFAVGDVREPGPEVAKEHRFEFLKPVVPPRSCYKCAEILTYEDGCKV